MGLGPGDAVAPSCDPRVLGLLFAQVDEECPNCGHERASFYTMQVWLSHLCVFPLLCGLRHAPLVAVQPQPGGRVVHTSSTANLHTLVPVPAGAANRWW